MNLGDGNGSQPPLSLLDYLLQHGWKIVRDRGRDEVSGLCPLHRETQPSFYVNRRKQVFYCHGCGRGGTLARLRRWLETPPPAMAPAEDLLEHTCAFYQRQLTHSQTARDYLARRGIHDSAVIQRMRIGYAPGACLRGHLMRLGYRRQLLADYGLIDAAGRDFFFRCLTFPLPDAANLYGRSLAGGPFRHRFLPRSKGGLYGWTQAVTAPWLIVVEGLLDVAALWQAGFSGAVAAMGVHLNRQQFAELQAAHRGLAYLCFDSDCAGEQAARALGRQLRSTGMEVLVVRLPSGHDPNSFFAAGATASDFQHCLDAAEGLRP